MKYVFDTGPLIDLFRHYYPTRFPSLWEQFHDLVSEGKLISVREVYNEINSQEDALTNWAKEEKDKLFSEPTIEEFQFVREIFKVKHFQAMIRNKERLQGKPVADPFVIARAKVLNCQVVTTEKFSKNSAKIPNVCKYFSVQCNNLEGFMEQEGWTF
jgi:predicted dehydrogenase